MKKRVYINILILMVGFFLMPMTSYACGSTSEKSCCKNEISSKTGKKDCCKKENHSKDKKNDGCGGKCKHTSCSCPSITFNITLPDLAEIKGNNFNFRNQKQKFFHHETYLSSGFYFFWQPPKIG